MTLRECPWCGEAFWRKGTAAHPVVFLLEHKQGCYLGPTTLLTLDTPKFHAWNNRITSDKLIQELNEMIARLRRSASPVTQNKQEDEFYDRTEKALEKGEPLL